MFGFMGFRNVCEFQGSALGYFVSTAKDLVFIDFGIKLRFIEIFGLRPVCPITKAKENELQSLTKRCHQGVFFVSWLLG